MSGNKLKYAKFLEGDAKEKLQKLPPESAQSVITSPPYWGLRDYDAEGQLGLEATPEEYIENLVEVFMEVRRVLRPDGTLWLNLGDSYLNKSIEGYEKQKDLVGIPWRVATALQRDGWYLRSDIIWQKCLCSSTRLYARTEKGVGTAMVKDLERLESGSFELWNGEEWTKVLSITESHSKESISITLRSGEKISCTPGHRWPLKDGSTVEAFELEEGDILKSHNLPEPDKVDNPKFLPDEDIGWIVGYYLAEGHTDKRSVKLAAHCEELDLVEKAERIAENLGSSCSRFRPDDSKCISLAVHGDIFKEVIKKYIRGSSADTKNLRQSCWKRSNRFLRSLFDGYLAGDGHYDEKNDRWRLGFTRNNRLAKDFRTLCARLGYSLTLKKSKTKGFGETWKTYRGEVRKNRSGHHNEKDRNEIVNIGNSQAKKFYDVAVEDDPHTFCLASGVSTHNSNTMPSSIKDRPTPSHEHIFLLAKNRKYYYDHQAIKEPVTSSAAQKFSPKGKPKKSKRDVWEVPTGASDFDHFAAFPLDLIEPCVKAGTSAFGQCKKCGAPYERVLEENKVKRNREERFTESKFQNAGGRRGCSQDHLGTTSETIGWEPTCECGVEETERQTVLDPFAGASTTGIAALKHDRKFFGVEINSDYIELSKERIREHEEVPANHSFW